MLSFHEGFVGSARGLLRNPGFTAIAVLTLGLGNGVSAAMFSIVDNILLDPLPFPEAERLVAVRTSLPGIDAPRAPNTQASYLLYQQESQALAAMGLYTVTTLNLTGEGPAERIEVADVTPSLFEVLQVRPEIGRLLQEKDGVPGAPWVAVLSHELWLRRFGGDPEILGKVLRINATQWEIVGVLPRDFWFPWASDFRSVRGTPRPLVWLSRQIDPTAPSHSNFRYFGIARLRPGITLEAAEAELSALIRRLPERYPEEGYGEFIERAGWAALVEPLKDDAVGDVKSTVWLLFACTSAVLLIACANVGGLYLVRLERRRREIALRAVLGSGGGALVQLFAAESLLLALGGGVVGVALAWAAQQVLVAYGPAEVPRLGEVGMGPAVVGFALALALGAAGFLAALAVLRTRRWSLAGVLSEAAASVTSGRRTSRVRGLLVAGQLALAFLLLTACALALESFHRLHAVEPGFRPEGVLTAEVALDFADYPRAEAAAGFYQRAVERLRALPGVRAAGAVGSLPLRVGLAKAAHGFEDHPLAPGEPQPWLLWHHISPGALEALGLPLVAGRALERADWEERRGVVLVNEALAERYWPGESALGKRLQLGNSPWYRVVGVVGDARYVSLEEPASPQVFYPLLGLLEGEGESAEEPWVTRDMRLVLRTDGDPLALAGPLRAALAEIDANVPVSGVKTLEDIVAEAGARTAFLSALLGLAALVGLLLGTLGLYGVVASAASQATREVGIRMALGATRGTVRGMFLRQGLRLSAVGVLLGGIGSLALARWAPSYLYGVRSFEPGIFVLMALVLFAVSLAAGYLPGRRAANLSPMNALRRG